MLKRAVILSLRSQILHNLAFIWQIGFFEEFGLWQVAPNLTELTFKLLYQILIFRAAAVMIISRRALIVHLGVGARVHILKRRMALLLLLLRATRNSPLLLIQVRMVLHQHALILGVVAI